MAKAPNRHRAEVELPGSPGGRFIRFTVDAMERLEAVYPDDWMGTVLDGLGKAKASIIIACIENAKVGEEPLDPRFFADEPGLLDEVIVAIREALYLTTTGKTPAEIEEEQAKKKREAQTTALLGMGVAEDQIEKLLSLSESGLLGFDQVSSPMISGPLVE